MASIGHGAVNGRTRRPLLRRPLAKRIGRVFVVAGGLPLGIEDPGAINDRWRAPSGPDPAVERLRRMFTNRASYQRSWREHPAFRDPDIWTPEVEA
jgi:hypothetical protein